MAEQKVKPKDSPSPSPGDKKPQIPQANVIKLEANRCAAEDCKKSPTKAGFCDEHYTWFKEGLITLQGQKAKDFDKKYHAWLRRKVA